MCHANITIGRLFVCVYSTHGRRQQLSYVCALCAGRQARQTVTNLCCFKTKTKTKTIYKVQEARSGGGRGRKKEALHTSRVYM